jgi:hypothetical protein
MQHQQARLLWGVGQHLEKVVRSHTLRAESLKGRSQIYTGSAKLHVQKNGVFRYAVHYGTVGHFRPYLCWYLYGRMQVLVDCIRTVLLPYFIAYTVFAGGTPQTRV